MRMKPMLSGRSRCFLALGAAVGGSSRCVASFLKRGIPRDHATASVPRQSLLSRQRPGGGVGVEKTVASLLEERRNRGSQHNEGQTPGGALGAASPSCCGGKEDARSATIRESDSATLPIDKEDARSATIRESDSATLPIDTANNTTAPATTGGGAPEDEATTSDGLVPTEGEVKEILADAAKRLKKWKEDETEANEKTRKSLKAIKEAAGLGKLLQMQPNDIRPLAAPHDDLIFGGHLPNVKLGEKQLFGGIGMANGPQGIQKVGVQGENLPGTAWPAAASIGMSWDPEFAYVYGRALAKEFRINRINTILGPSVSTWRVPQGGRNFESIAGEDPVLPATLLPPYKLATNELGVVTTLKHYLLNDQENHRKRYCSSTPLRAIFEMQLKNWAAALAMGGNAVMCAYNWICGHADAGGSITKKMCVGNCLNKWSLSWITELSERFYVMSDWGATGATYGYSLIREEWPDKEPGLVAGVDGKTKLPKPLMEFYLRAGLSSEQGGTEISSPPLDPSVDPEVQEKAARRIVATMEDVETSGPNLLKEERISTADYEALKKKHAQVGSKLVADSIVLLKNENRALPLLLRPEDGADGVVIGTYGCADKRSGSGYVTGTGSGDVTGTGTISIAHALRDATEEMRRSGFDINYSAPDQALQSILSLVPQADVSDGKKREVVLICVGPAFPGGEDVDRSNINLATLTSMKKSEAGDHHRFQVVLYVISPGYMRLPKADVVDAADAILLSVLPGQCAGRGLVRVLFNESPPSAKLSFTIGNYDEGSHFYSPVLYDTAEAFHSGVKLLDYTKTDGEDGMQTGYRWYQARKVEPLFPFGYGLTSLADWSKDFRVSVKKHDPHLRRISFCVDFSLPDGAGDAWATLNAKAGRGRNVVKASPVVQFFVKKLEPDERTYFELLAFAKLANMKPLEKRCAAVFYTEPPATFSQREKKYVSSTSFELFVSLNGFAEGSGLQKVETVEVEPKVKSYSLKDYYNFVKETVMKQTFDLTRWPVLSAHTQYLNNGDEVFENWAA